MFHHILLLQSDLGKLNLKDKSINNTEVLGDIPAVIVRCNTKEDIVRLDKDLADLAKFSEILKHVGGVDVADTTRRILSALLTTNVAKLFNWTGRKGKEKFSDCKNIKTLIDAAIRKSAGEKVVNFKEVDSTIKAWFRGAGDRDGGRWTFAQVAKRTSEHRA